MITTIKVTAAVTVTRSKGANKMKKLVLGTILLAMAIVAPVPAMAGVDVHIGINLPPPVVFEAPPQVIVLPDTNYVYVVPDIGVDIFFWNGWWWRPWAGGWYRSYYYDRGWTYYNYVPRFYYDVDPGWRGHYRDHNWYGHRWNYEPIPHQQLQQNWKRWDHDRYWERQRTWGVQNYQPRPQQQRQELRQQRQRQYQQNPEVQRHQQERQQRQKQLQGQQPQGQQQRPSQARQPQQQQRQPQVQPAEKGKAIAPQAGPAGSGKRQQVQPAEKKRPQGGPAPAGEQKKAKPEKKVKPVEPGEGRESREGRRSDEPRNAPVR